MVGNASVWVAKGMSTKAMETAKRRRGYDRFRLFLV